MTDKTEKAFEEFYYLALSYRNADYKFRDMYSKSINEIVGKDNIDAAQNAVKEALKPFVAKRELEIYKAAKNFVETYEANDLSE